MTLGSSMLENFSQAIQSGPLAVYHLEKNIYTYIPASTQAIVLADQDWQDLRHEARSILNALGKVAEWLNLDAQRAKADRLYSGLSALEKAAAQGPSAVSKGLATARLDLFFDGNSLSVIEVNTTIPAMQAYGDMIRSAYFQAYGWPQQTLLDNTQDLLLSLLEHYVQSGGQETHPRIGIAARQGDSQQAELLWLQKKWQASGYETLIYTPDQVRLKDLQVWVGSTPIDLNYRHIFANKVLPHSAFAMACQQSLTYRVFNPISAHLEAKGVLAELSRIAADERLSLEIGLTASERQATQQRVVWSRLLNDEGSVLPDGEIVPNMLPWIEAHSHILVVKSSHGYGGQNVFIGQDFLKPSTQMRAQKLLGVTRAITWSEFIKFCSIRGRDQWIVQKKLEGRRIKHQVLTEGQFTEQNSFIDCSIFTSSGISHLPSGGASRFSTDSIVNIGRGGGLAPLLMESESNSLVGSP